MATAKGTTAKSKPANPPGDWSGVGDPALKKRWQKVLARYRAAVASSSTGWDDRYEALDDYR